MADNQMAILQRLDALERRLRVLEVAVAAALEPMLPCTCLEPNTTSAVRVCPRHGVRS